MRLGEVAKRFGVSKSAVQRAFRAWAFYYHGTVDAFRDPNGWIDVPQEFIDWMENSHKQTIVGVAEELGVHPDTLFQKFKEWCELRGVSLKVFRRPVWIGRLAYRYVLPRDFIEWYRAKRSKREKALENFRRACEVIRRARPGLGEKGVKKWVVKEYLWWCEITGRDPERVDGHMYNYTDEFVRWLEVRYLGGKVSGLREEAQGE